jgi:hypothetical protein
MPYGWLTSIELGTPTMSPDPRPYGESPGKMSAKCRNIWRSDSPQVLTFTADGSLAEEIPCSDAPWMKVGSLSEPLKVPWIVLTGNINCEV